MSSDKTNNSYIMNNPSGNKIFNTIGQVYRSYLDLERKLLRNMKINNSLDKNINENDNLKKLLVLEQSERKLIARELGKIIGYVFRELQHDTYFPEIKNTMVKASSEMIKGSVESFYYVLSSFPPFALLLALTKASETFINYSSTNMVGFYTILNKIVNILFSSNDTMKQSKCKLNKYLLKTSETCDES